MTPTLRTDCVTYAVDDKVLISKVELHLHPGSKTKNTLNKPHLSMP